MSEEELTEEIRERHTPEDDAREAHELLDEAVSLWDDLDHTGRISRLRQASDILKQTLDENATLHRREDTDVKCTDCGSSELASEEIGNGRRRVYCPNCDLTHQV